MFLINEVMKKSHAILVYVTDKDSVLCPHQEAVTDYILYIILLEWTTSLDTSSRTLFVRMCVHVYVERRVT